jgi:tRNA pseudouridine55 synthase
VISRRDVHGILLLNKPKGITSNAALQNVKRLFSSRKAGHSGSLDPIASGLLPVCFGEATKFARFLLESDKRYQVTARLGIRTDTGDAEGRIIREHSLPATFSTSLLEEILQQFRGECFQIPSMYSAIKHQGQPLYKFARLGMHIERKARPISVTFLKILDCFNDLFSLEIHVSKGTYIRTLIDDIGEVLGCGAHVTELNRIGVGVYQALDMHSLAHLGHIFEQNGVEALDNCLLSIDSTVGKFPKVILSHATAGCVRQGQAVWVPNVPTAGWVRLMLDEDQFLGIGQILDDGRVAPRRLIGRHFG